MLEVFKSWFGKNRKEPHDYKIKRDARKRNWLGLVKVYDSYETIYNWCFIRLGSHQTDDDCITSLKNTLTIGWGPSYKIWELPFSLIKPIVDYHSYKKDQYDKVIEPKEIWFTTYKERRYEIFLDKEEGYLRFSWNKADNFLYNITKHKGYEKWIHFFWKQTRRVKNELLNTNFSLYKDIQNIESDYDKVKEIEASQPYFLFNVMDYDKEELTVVGKLVRWTYVYGNGRFTRFIMKFFKEPEVYTRMELTFSKEVGTGKGSWKGGTVGHSVSLENLEDPVDAFKNYCLNRKLRGSKNYNYTNLTYLGYSVFKEYGITDSMLVKMDQVNWEVKAVLTLNKDFVPHELDFSDFNIPIIFNIFNTIEHLKDIELYYLKDEKSLTVFLFRLYLYKTREHERVTESNCLMYYFTEEVVDFLCAQESSFIKKEDFVKVENYGDA